MSRNALRASSQQSASQLSAFERHEIVAACKEYGGIVIHLAGSVRAFNQDLLSKDLIEEQLVFYTVEGDRKMWRFFDPRTYRSATFDQEYLVSVMEQLI
jgi:hypothetical protein